jgi:hypothetical protein
MIPFVLFVGRQASGKLIDQLNPVLYACLKQRRHIYGIPHYILEFLIEYSHINYLPFNFTTSTE